jgi:hypothetical protein
MVVIRSLRRYESMKCLDAILLRLGGAEAVFMLSWNLYYERNHQIDT